MPVQVHSNLPVGGDDNSYGPFSKAEVLNASTDLLGNSLLGIHGHPVRGHQFTLAEVCPGISLVFGGLLVCLYRAT